MWTMSVELTSRPATSKSHDPNVSSVRPEALTPTPWSLMDTVPPAGPADAKIRRWGMTAVPDFAWTLNVPCWLGPFIPTFSDAGGTGWRTVIVTGLIVTGKDATGTPAGPVSLIV